jgi:hypothetical protein
MTAIKHLDHRTADQNDAILFGQIINQACGPTLSQCLAALAEWHTRHHDFGMIAPEDIIEIIKAHRPSAHLSEKRIGELLAGTEGMDAERYLTARRELLAGVNRGLSESDASHAALAAARHVQVRQIEAKPRKPVQHHFAGRLRLGDVIGNQERETL